MARRIGRYEIQAELGRGGFGQVFRAFDPTVGRQVAIKTLNAGGEAELLTRFRNEAAAAGQLRHPNIVTIYDFGDHEGTPFMVMELLEGEDLQHVIANARPLSLVHRLEIMRQVADGLHNAHLRGIVHRDVKPANVMLLAEGNVKILDFGIALLTQEARSRLTPQGNVIGTFRYMAPEQFYGSATDLLSDIFAYGLVFYELLTGAHPFAGTEPAAVMYNIMHTAHKPLREVSTDYPEALEQLVARILAKDRDSRYQSLEDVLFDLGPVLQEMRKDRANRLVDDAQRLASQDQVDAAQSVLREILELDSTNRTARQLREVLQQQVQRRALRPRIDALLKTGQEQMAGRQFQSAIETLESALKLDKSNSQIHVVLEQARAMLDQARRVDSLLTEARHAMQQRNLTGAYSSAAEALQADPANTSAASLVSQIRAEMEGRERERILREGLTEATEHLRRYDFDAAIARLTGLRQQYPESRDISDLLARAQKDKIAHLRQQHLESELKEAHAEMRAQHYGEAVGRLEKLRGHFPDTAEVRDLLTLAQRELAAQRQAEAAARVEQEIRRLVERKEFPRAIKLLEEAIRRIPGNRMLESLLQSTRGLQEAFNRRAALDETLKVARSLLSGRRFTEAIAKLDAFSTEYGTDGLVADLRASIVADEVQFRRQEALKRLAGDIRELMRQQKSGAAIQIARRALTEFPDHGELQSLLSLAQAQQKEQQRLEAVNRILSETTTLAATQRYDQALEVLRDGLASYPSAQELLDHQAKTLQEKAARAREKEEQAKREQERQAAEEAERKRKAAEAEAQRQAALAREREAEARRQQERQAAEEAERKRKVAEAEAQRQAALAREREAEARRQQERQTAEEAERKRKVAEAEAQRQAALARERDVEARRQQERQAAEEAERKRKVAEAEAQRQAGLARERDVEARRQQERQAAEEAERKRKVAEAEAQRQAGLAREREAEARRQQERQAAEEAERKRKADEAEAQRWAIPAREGAARRAFEEAERQRMASSMQAVGPTAPPRKLPKAALGGAIAAVLFAGGFLVNKLSGPNMQPVEFRSLVPGVTVRVANQNCTTPACRLALTPGSYTIEATAPGYAKLSRSIEVGSKATIIELQMQAENIAVPSLDTRPSPPPPVGKGALSVQANVEGAEVLINGERAGITDKRGSLSIELEAGKQYVVDVRKHDLQQPVGQIAMLTEGATTRLSFNLAGAEATLLLRDGPAGAAVKLGSGQVLGAIGPDGSFSAKLPPGNQTIELTKERFLTKKIARTFTAGQTITLNSAELTLAPIPIDPQVAAAQEWEKVRDSQDPAVLDDFRVKYRGTAQATQAEDRLQEVQWERLNKRDASLLRDYQSKYPRTRHAREIADALASIDWNSLDKNDPAKLRDFQSRYPGTDMANRAAQEIARLERERQLAAERQKQTDPPVKSAGSPDAAAIRAVLTRFASAYSQKDINGMRGAWPSISKKDVRRYTDAFQEKGSLSMTIRTVQDPAISGDNATALCEITTQSSAQGRTVPGGSLVRVTLIKKGGAWVIDNVRQ